MNHEIVIDNAKPGEIFYYPFTLIKGHIINRENKPCQEETEISAKINDKSVSINLLNKDRFKIFFELNLGNNELTINYCCCTLNYLLCYQSRNTIYKVLPLYVICEGHDGCFQAPENEKNDPESATKRITICSKLIQCIIGEKLHEQNLERKSFCLESDCQIFYSSLKAEDVRKMEQDEIWKALGKEIVSSSIGSETRKYLAFLSCTRYCGEKYLESMISHKDIVNITEGYAALGGGGLALFGTACLFTWPENIFEISQRFENSTLIDKKLFMDDSCYRGTYGGCFTTTLGSVLHELCHTFDLGHTDRGVMGRGFDNIDKIFINKNETNATITQTYQCNIEFKEKLDSGRLSERLKDIKKEFFIKPSLKDEGDDTFWTKSCSVLLNYHKWFNNEANSAKPSSLKYDPLTKFVTSTTGLRVVELRREKDEFVLNDWTFDGRILKYSFQIPEEHLKNKLLLVVEDNFGNILKELIN